MISQGFFTYYELKINDDCEVKAFDTNFLVKFEARCQSTTSSPQKESDIEIDLEVTDLAVVVDGEHLIWCDLKTVDELIMDTITERVSKFAENCALYDDNEWQEEGCREPESYSGPGVNE